MTTQQLIKLFVKLSMVIIGTVYVFTGLNGSNDNEQFFIAGNMWIIASMFIGNYKNGN